MEIDNEKKKITADYWESPMVANYLFYVVGSEPGWKVEMRNTSQNVQEAKG